MAKIIGNTTVTPVMPSNWAQTDETKVDYIKNKPTKLSQFENDSKFVKDTDYAANDKHGIIKGDTALGIRINTSGVAYIDRATEAQIDAKADKFKPIVPFNLEYAVKSVGDIYYAKEDAVFETSSFGWTDFPYDIEAAEWDTGYGLSDNMIQGAGTGFTIHCKGSTIGFDFTIDNPGYSYIVVNGVEYNGNGNIPLSYMESDIVVYCSFGVFSFSGMVQKNIKGVSEIKAQIGDIDTALDRIIEIQTNFTGEVDVEFPGDFEEVLP